MKKELSFATITGKRNSLDTKGRKMEVNPTQHPAPRPAWRRPGAILAAVALALYAILLARYMGACAGGSDSSGYFNHARLMDSGRLHVAVRAVPGLVPKPTESYLFIPLGFRRAPDGDGLVPTYPPGLPLLLLAAKSAVGWGRAADWALGIHAILGLLLTYALGRKCQLSVRWSAAAAAILAASPLYLFMSVQAMSDVPALVWTAAAVLAAWNSRDRAGWAAAAGFAVGMAVLIRPNNALVLAPVAIALGASPRRWLRFAAGGLPAAVFFCAHSHAAYGSFFATGYVDTRSSFGIAFAGPALRHYARWLPLLFTPVVAFALGIPFTARSAPREAAILGSWLLAYFAFFSVYFYTHEAWWYLRFLLPAAPALIVGGLGVARAVAGRWTRRAPRLAWAAALAFILVNGAYGTEKRHALSIGRGERKYARTADWLLARVPADAVVASMEFSGAVFFYTPMTMVRYDQIEPGDFPRIAAAARAVGRPIYAVLFPFEVDAALRGRMPGPWEQAGAVGDVTIWRWEGR